MPTDPAAVNYFNSSSFIGLTLRQNTTGKGIKIEGVCWGVGSERYYDKR
jgi:hypothetical protein